MTNSEEQMSIQEEIVSQGTVALKALMKFQKASKKKALFPEQDSSVFLMCKYKKIALKKEPFHRRLIQLPHSDRNPSNTSICLILPDMDRSHAAKRDHDVDRQAREWAEILRTKHGISSADVAKIMTFTQMEREFSQPIEKTQLANSYDIFLVDNVLMTKAFGFLGQNFKKPGKMPFPVHSERSSLAEEIERSYSLISLSIEPLKDSVSVRIGNLGQSLAELTANLEVIVENVLKYAPGGECNIRACYVQVNNSEASLPVYVDFGSSNDVKLAPSRKRVYSEIYGECSTLPDGLAVKVRADGEVTVVDEGKEV